MAETVTTEYQVEYGDSPTYRWAIRLLYATAIGMEIYVLWKASADDVEVAILREKVTRWVKEKTRPLRVAKDWPISVNRMHRHAEWTLREADNAA